MNKHTSTGSTTIFLDGKELEHSSHLPSRILSLAEDHMGRPQNILNPLNHTCYLPLSKHVP